MTLPSIPDNLYKLFLLVAIFCLAFAYLEDRHNNDKYFSKVDNFNASIDSLNIEILKINHQGQKLVKAADYLSQRNNIQNPITKEDTLEIFQQAISGSKIEVSVSDSLSKLWSDWKENQFKVGLFDKQIIYKIDALREAKKEYEETYVINMGFQLGGYICLVLGLIGMTKIQDMQDDQLKRQLQEKPRTYKYCQSCGKNFLSMRQNARNNDGTITQAFCSSCHANGQFTEPELTKEEFQKRTASELKKRKTWLGKKILTSRLSNLERWDIDEYC